MHTNSTSHVVDLYCIFLTYRDDSTAKCFCVFDRFSFAPPSSYLVHIVEYSSDDNLSPSKWHLDLRDVFH